jgi:hypothetical protein
VETEGSFSSLRQTATGLQSEQFESNSQLRYTCFTSIVTIYTQIFLVVFSLQNIPPQVRMRYSSRRLRSFQLVLPDIAYYTTCNLVTYTGSTV